MNEWFECRVKYDKVQPDGLIKRVSELYLVEGLSFTEAEKGITKELEEYMSGEFVVDTLKRAKVAELFVSDDAASDRWFRIKVGFITIDEKTEQEKISNFNYMVLAVDVKSALETLTKNMADTMGDYRIGNITETKILDVFHHKVED